MPKTYHRNRFSAYNYPGRRRGFSGDHDFCQKECDICCTTICNCLTCQCCKDEPAVRNTEAHLSKEYVNQNISQSVERVWIKQKEKREKFNDECSICYDHRASLILQCGHSFHPKCITTWLKKARKCPNCKSTRLEKVRVFC